MFTHKPYARVFIPAFSTIFGPNLCIDKRFYNSTETSIDKSHYFAQELVLALKSLYVVSLKKGDTMDPVQIIADWIKEVQCAIAFTGAGISTESGIRDFRSPDSVLARSRPV